MNNTAGINFILMVFILSDLSSDQLGEEPILDAKEIVMVLPKDDDVKIYFY